jgi:sulfur carrier protein
MNITVNDEPRALPAAATLETLIAELGRAGRGGLAVAVNDSVVPRARWGEQTLAEGDRVLVIRATQGG